MHDLGYEAIFTPGIGFSILLVHGREDFFSKERINERRNSRALGQDDQPPEEE